MYWIKFCELKVLLSFSRWISSNIDTLLSSIRAFVSESVLAKSSLFVDRQQNDDLLIDETDGPKWKYGFGRLETFWNMKHEWKVWSRANLFLSFSTPSSFQIPTLILLVFQSLLQFKIIRVLLKTFINFSFFPATNVFFINTQIYFQKIDSTKKKPELGDRWFVMADLENFICDRFNRFRFFDWLHASGLKVLSASQIIWLSNPGKRHLIV